MLLVHHMHTQTHFLLSLFFEEDQQLCQHPICVISRWIQFPKLTILQISGSSKYRQIGGLLCIKITSNVCNKEHRLRMFEGAEEHISI